VKKIKKMMKQCERSWGRKERRELWVLPWEWRGWVLCVVHLCGKWRKLWKLGCT
jgi:hypothetical protein